MVTKRQVVKGNIDFKDELKILKELGISPYEIEYLISKKQYEEFRGKN